MKEAKLLRRRPREQDPMQRQSKAKPVKRGGHTLDWLNFFLADVTMARAPYPRHLPFHRAEVGCGRHRLRDDDRGYRSHRRSSGLRVD